MRRSLGLAAAVAFLVAFVALAFFLNPTEVDFHLSPDTTFRLPLGLLLVGTMVVGVLIAVVAVAVQQLNHRLATWSERRKARQDAQVEELNESGAALAWSGETDRSRAVLKKAWRRDPGNREAAIALAASYTETGEHHAARQVLEDAVAESPADPDLRFELGQTLASSGSPDEAMRMLETVRVQYPRAARVLVALRDLYQSSGRWAEAVETQTEYISQLASSESIHDERDRLRDFRYRAALQLATTGERRKALEAILEEHRDYAPAIESLGDELVAQEHSFEATRIWERAFKREPSLSLANRLLAQLDDPAGRQRVLSLINKHADELAPDAVHMLRARIAIEDDALETAQKELEAITDATNPAVQATWADLHQKRGDHERAWQTLRPLAG